ncbi:hypothetical protein Acr_09g0006440 [Actinidia rufa]|uniref:VQ motif-containing protein n=1 Tax=Actinidia rufa TaxID=165716 RepID=A0A7J0F661_9ERIC|nr:hypothetical protein Acr_09g0006440 [Actinidia rufa]
MQSPESSGDGTTTPTRRQLQGPRPPQLRVRKESHAIRKPPQALPPQPVIIYAMSPKVIHNTVSDFISLVHRLVGSSSVGDVSPATRLASIERTSLTDREKAGESTSDPGDFIAGSGNPASDIARILCAGGGI